MSVELTERLLMEAGGWQAAKHARALVEAGRVLSAAYQPPVLKGLVREGNGEIRSGLKISSKTDIENICSCRQSRQWGQLCEHSLAVGYAVLNLRAGQTISGKPRPGAVPTPQAASAPVPTAPATPPPNVGPSFATEGEGEGIALSVVLPPQFIASWERGRITLGVEVERNGRRALLDSLGEKGAFRCSAQDLKLIETIRKLNGGALGGMLSLTREQALILFEGLQGHPGVSLARKTPVHFSVKPVRPRLEAKTDPLGRLLLHIQWPADTRLLFGDTRAWVATGAIFSPVAPGLPAAYLELLRKDIMLPAEQAGGFLINEMPMLKAHFEIEGDAMGADAPQLIPEAGHFELTVEGSLNHLTARLERVYTRRAVIVGLTPVSENWATPDASDPKRLFCRNIEAERDALERLRHYGFTGPDATGHLTLKGERAILQFFGEGYPRLEQEWQVRLGARFTNVSQQIERVTPRVEVRNGGLGEEWFEMQFDLAASGGERFSALDVQRFLQMGQNHVRLKSGKIAVFSTELLDDFRSVLRDCNPEQQRPGVYRINRAHAGYLAASVEDAGFGLKAPPSWKNWARNQQGSREIEAVDLGDLEPVLRNYQKEGVAWLHFLSGNGLGGILADDMGLGKTLQALAFLRKQPGVSLVICPSSLIFNWQREAERFTPDRKVLVIEGGRRRALFEQVPDVDLVITSYPLLRRDIEHYRAFDFSTIILDEAQHIKNPDTQNAQAAINLRANRKFILTGTPVENSVRDVWSLMNFVMPGYLGDRDDFRERYEMPITRHQSKETLERLARRLRPFLLRRRKQEVASDLPEKLEQVAYCELNTRQKAVYSALLEGARAQVEVAQGEKNAGRARMMMLTALLRLRQAACDLRLIEKDAPPTGEKEPPSGKVELFGELLQEAIDGGHRVLVFSQFVSMLSLLRAELEANGVEYCYLDGQTQDRSGVVDRFQTGEVPVFLISLKAGGVGLNLTAADTVIHFDPWWNPAVEAQATDRAHRIGQEKVVTSYKLIARGTVEEKILALQRKKREIIDATIENEQPLMEGLTMSDIEALLME